MNKRILIFSLAYFPFVGGAEVAVKEIADRLGGEFEFEMLTVNLDGGQAAEEKMGNILVRRIGRGKLAKYFFPFTAYRLAKKLQKENKFDAIWAVMANQAGLAALFFKWGLPKVQYLLTLQEGDSERDIWIRTWFIRPLYKMIYRRADRIQAISGFLAERAKKMGAKCRIDTIPNGVETANFNLPNEQTKNEARRIILQSLHLPQDAKIVVTASRLVKKNGVGDLISAFKFLPSKANLLVIGQGDLNSELKYLSRQEKVSERVHFLGNKNHIELPGFLWGSDVFCRPSLSEGLGNAFLEAMAAGLPVVGTNVGGIPDFLKDGETGLFCRPNDPKDIADKIKMIFDNFELAKKMAKNGQELARAGGRYDWTTIIAQMKNIFDELCVS